MSELYRTVHEAMEALRGVAPKDSLRQRIEGACILTAPFNKYAAAYPYQQIAVPTEGRINIVRQIILEYTPFISIFKRRSKRENKQRKVAAEERKHYEQLVAHLPELRLRTMPASYVRHLRRKGETGDLYCLTLCLALRNQSSSSLAVLASEVGKKAEEALPETYAVRGLIRDGQSTVSNDALLVEYDFFGRLLQKHL